MVHILLTIKNSSLQLIPTDEDEDYSDKNGGVYLRSMSSDDNLTERDRLEMEERKRTQSRQNYLDRKKSRYKYRNQEIYTTPFENSPLLRYLVKKPCLKN